MENYKMKYISTAKYIECYIDRMKSDFENCIILIQILKF